MTPAANTPAGKAEIISECARDHKVASATRAAVTVWESSRDDHSLPAPLNEEEK